VFAPRASSLLAMLQLARGIAAIGGSRHLEAFEHLQRLFAPADPAFHLGLQFFALADFVEAAVYSDRSQAARSVIDEIERLSAPRPVPWVETMLSYGKALVATDEDAERFFLQGLGPAAKNWPFLRGRLLFGYGTWLRRQRKPTNARAPLREARGIFDALGAQPWIDRVRKCEQPAKPAFVERSRFGRSSLHKSCTSRSSLLKGFRTRQSQPGCICHTEPSAGTCITSFRRPGSPPDPAWDPFSPQPA